jgi:hypothetical protein
MLHHRPLLRLLCGLHRAPSVLTRQKETIKAYIDHGEGIDRAGGFAIQVSYILPRV